MKTWNYFTSNLYIIQLHSGAIHIFSTNAPIISGHVADTPSLLVALPDPPPVKKLCCHPMHC